MYKKIMLYFLLTNTVVAWHNVFCSQETLIISSDDNNQENISDHYDHLDYLADNEPEIVSHRDNVPVWVKSFFLGIILNLARASELWHKTMKKIKHAFSRKDHETKI